MSADATAAQRAYAAIKQLILEERLAVLTHLDIEALAQRFGMSSMPIRQALSELHWERHVRPARRAGYEIALWSADELCALYQWRGDLLEMTLPAPAGGSEAKRALRTRAYAPGVFAVMRLMEEGANEELKRAALQADERLHLARLAEGDVLGDVEGEFQTLAEALFSAAKTTKTLIRRYHRRRIDAAKTLRERVVLRSLPSNGGASRRS